MSSWLRRACLLCVLRRARSPCHPWGCVLGVPRLDLGVVGRLAAGLVVAVVPMMDVRCCRRFVKLRLPPWLVVNFSPDRRTSTRRFSPMILLLPRLRLLGLARRSLRTTCASRQRERVAARLSALRVGLRGVGRNQLVRHLQIENCAEKRRHTII